MTTKHTPGPWVVGRPTEYGTFSCGVVCKPDGEGIANVLSMPTNGTLEELSERYAEPVANARLIAAAPDLLNALVVLAAAAESRGIPADAARAAIAKATGAA